MIRFYQRRAQWSRPVTDPGFFTTEVTEIIRGSDSCKCGDSLVAHLLGESLVALDR
jgi:hypothetical protein